MFIKVFPLSLPNDPGHRPASLELKFKSVYIDIEIITSLFMWDKNEKLKLLQI